MSVEHLQADLRDYLGDHIGRLFGHSLTQLVSSSPPKYACERAYSVHAPAQRGFLMEWNHVAVRESIMEGKYETTKEYLIRGIKASSEVVKDEKMPAERARSLFIRSSCASTRWGVRTQDHSYSCPTEWEAFETSFEEIRHQAAETLVRTELGEVPEKSAPLLVVELVGPTGQRMTPACAVDLSFSPSLLGPEFIELLKFERTGQLFCEIVNGQIHHIPLHRGRVKFGEYEAETTFLPATYNGPVVLGGDFFQKVLKGKEGLITELVMPDHFRTLANAARCKKRYALIVGSYGERRERLKLIKEALVRVGLVGLILDEYPDIEEQTLTEKMVTYASICRFVIADDIAPSGHIKELDICHDLKFITAVLRPKGRASTAMQADISDEVSFIKGFDYEEDAELGQLVEQAAAWASEAVSLRSQSLNRKYSGWRSPVRIQG
jgi:hypothetical protein